MRDKAVGMVAFVMPLVACTAPLPSPSPSPDVSADCASVDSREKAQELKKAGALEKVYLFPLEGGGQDVEINTVYVPRKAALEKAAVDQEIVELGQQGKVSKYNAKPEYVGRSFVPFRIVVEASGTESIRRVIEVW